MSALSRDVPTHAHPFAHHLLTPPSVRRENWGIVTYFFYYVVIGLLVVVLSVCLFFAGTLYAARSVAWLVSVLSKTDKYVQRKNKEDRRKKWARRAGMGAGAGGDRLRDVLVAGQNMGRRGDTEPLLR